MSRILVARLCAPRTLGTLILLAALAIGSALRGLHHLQDPGCIDGSDRGGHACAVCAGLHSSTPAAMSQSAPTPNRGEWTPIARATVPVPHARSSAAASPRAPPAS